MTLIKTSAAADIAATTFSIAVAVGVLANTNNGRITQECVPVELIAFIMFLYAEVKSSRWWFTGTSAVILVWVAAAHVDVLWR